MTVSVNARWLDVSTTDGIAFSDDGAVLRYVCTTDSNELEPAVRAAMHSAAPATYEGLIKGPLELERGGDDIWFAEVEYVPVTSPAARPKLEVDDVQWSITSGSGGTQKRVFSKELVSENATETKYEWSGTPAERVLGVSTNADGAYEVEGIDTPIGEIAIEIKTTKSEADVTAGYLVTLADAAKERSGNSLQWNVFPAKTLQLRTFSAVERAGTSPPYDITIGAVYSPNLTSVSIGNGLSVSTKAGHDIIDVLFVRKTVNGLPLSVPVRAAVHRVVDYIDFATVLGI